MAILKFNIMKAVIMSFALLVGFMSVFAQTNLFVDDQGIAFAAQIKKISKKAKYGVVDATQNFEFGTTKGITGEPVVTAEERGEVELVAAEDQVTLGYLLDYNQFVKVKHFYYGVFYRRNFKTETVGPQRVSLTSDGIFLDDAYGYYHSYKTENAGQRCRFNYLYQFTDAKYLTRVFFHSGIPAKQKSVSFKIPNWLNLEIAEKNFGDYKIRKEVKKEKDFTIVTYWADNLIDIKKESSDLSRPYYLPHLVITVRNYTVGQKEYNGFKTLGDLYTWYNFLYNKAENNTSDIKPLVTQLINGKTTDEEKIKAIYYWVQDNIRYIAFEEGYAGFVPQTVQEVYKNKYGDCKGMANLVTEMLKIAGFDAHFAWIGTREIPYDHAEVQSMCVDNHAISVLYHKGKTYFIDGTEKYASLGSNAYRIQGKSVLVQNGESYKLEKVPLPKPDENKIKTVAKLKMDGDKIVGRVTLTYTGEGKNFFHNVYNNIPSNKRKELITRLVELNNTNSEASNVKTSDFKNRDIDIVIEGDIEISNQITVVDNNNYTNIDFFPGAIVGFIPGEDRQNPIDIDAVFVIQDDITLELPKNTKIVNLPPQLEANYEQNIIKVAYQQQGNSIVLNKHIQLFSPIIKTKEFEPWKKFINKIKEYNRNSLNIQL